MTSTPVTNIGSQLSTVPSKNAFSAFDSENSFGDIMNQTQNKSFEPKEAELEKTAVTGQTKVEGRRDRVSSKEESQSEEVTRAQETDRTEVNELSQEEMDAVNEAAQEMLEEVSKELGISEEELLQMMELLGMTMVDLLNPEQLTLLVTQTAGGDPLLLTTDEKLYTSMQKLLGELQNTIQELSAKLDVSPKQMQEFLKEIDRITVTTTQEDGALPELRENELMVDAKETEGQTEEVQSKHQKEADGENTAQVESSVDTVEETTADTANDSTLGNEAQGQETSRDNTGASRQEESPFVVNQNLINQLVTNQTNVENPFMQTVHTAYGEVNPAEIMRQFTEFMSLLQTEDLTEMELQLNPANLGSIHVSIASKAGEITATLTTQNEAVRNVLESQIMIVRENLENQGIKVEAIEIAVATHAFEHNLSDSQSDADYEEQQTNSKKNGIRRIDLNLPLEEGEELDDETKLAREMMEMNGNTVDYTA
ncbi:MAG: flagellar hook-length control protein FliK [Lachnospiraceae bacterium]|nr:flagellar hook-length control protein FliK [Lachnospiraceae bacterium]